MKFLLLFFTLFQLLALNFCSANSNANHVEITYSFWDEDSDASENAQIYSRLLANDNRFWTTSFKKVDCSLNPKDDEVVCSGGKISKIGISCLEPSKVAIQEPIKYALSSDFSQFLVNTFRNFSSKYFSSLAIKSEFFDQGVFSTLSQVYEDLEIANTAEFERKLAENAYILFVRKQNFENWEAILHFVDAVRRTKKLGAIVDCERLANVCDSQNVSDDSLPLLLAHRKEEFYKKFDLKFEQDQVHDWILTLEQPDITKLTEDAVPYYRSGIVPGFSDVRDTVSMLFIPTKKSVVYQNFVKFAKLNHGRFHLTALVSKEVAKWAHQPAFITMKPRDNYIKAFTLYQDITYDKMANYLEEGSHPSMHQIASARDFSFSLPASKPLVIFFDPRKTKNSTNFQIFASNHQMQPDRDAYFSLIQGLDLFGLYLAEILEAPSEAYISIRRLNNGYCANFRALTEEKELKWIKELQSEKCEKMLEDALFPIARLQYLERVDDVAQLQKEMLEKQSTHDEL